MQVIVRSNSYIHAIQKMQRALYEFQIRGVKTNILFLENVLRHPEFLSGRATTSFLDDNPQLFSFHQDAGSQSSQVLAYLGDMVRVCQQTCSLCHPCMLLLPTMWDVVFVNSAMPFSHMVCQLVAVCYSLLYQAQLLVDAPR